jgi:hypothetical protein
MTVIHMTSWMSIIRKNITGLLVPALSITTKRDALRARFQRDPTSVLTQTI